MINFFSKAMEQVENEVSLEEMSIDSCDDDGVDVAECGIQFTAPKEDREPIYMTAVDGRKLACFYAGDCPLSNYYTSEFEIPGHDAEEKHLFTSMEQYMQWKKAMLFEDENTAKRIMGKEVNPMEAKFIGRDVKGFLKSKWRVHCNEVGQESTAIIYDLST